MIHHNTMVYHSNTMDFINDWIQLLHLLMHIHLLNMVELINLRYILFVIIYFESFILPSFPNTDFIIFNLPKFIFLFLLDEKFHREFIWDRDFGFSLINFNLVNVYITFSNWIYIFFSKVDFSCLKSFGFLFS